MSKLTRSLSLMLLLLVLAPEQALAAKKKKPKLQNPPSTSTQVEQAPAQVQPAAPAPSRAQVAPGEQRQPAAEPERGERAETSGTPADKQRNILFDTSPQERRPMLSAFGILPWWLGFGIGIAPRYTIPLVHEGLIPSLNDSIELELGGDFWFSTWRYFGVDYSYVGLAAPVVEARWTFHFSPRLAAYAKMGFGLNFWFFQGRVPGATYESSWGGFYPNGASGVIYQLNDVLSIRGEAGYLGLRVGVGLKL